jgi:hypothetical protein
MGARIVLFQQGDVHRVERGDVPGAQEVQRRQIIVGDRAMYTSSTHPAGR